jgi:hypothetical protein
MEQEIKVVAEGHIQIITPQPTPDPLVEDVLESDLKAQISTLIQEKDNLCRWHEFAMDDKDKSITNLQTKLAIFDQDDIKTQIKALTAVETVAPVDNVEPAP